MFPHGWIVWYLFLAVPLALCSLDIIESNGGVTCSKGLWDCTMKDGTLFDLNSVRVTDLSPQVKLCCRGHTCALCLQLHVTVDLDKAGEEERPSGLTDDESAEETTVNEEETGSVTLCYKTPHVLPACKKVEFTVKTARPPPQSTDLLSRAQISILITKSVITYGNLVYTYSSNMLETGRKAVSVPSLEDVCSSEINTYVAECNVPKISFSINKANQVELHFPGSNHSDPEVCLQNELDGICQKWDGKPIPLEAVAPCTCFQAWKAGDQIRSRICPFRNNSTPRQNLLKNLTLSVNKDDTMLWWNVSSPCRLQGEVQPCERTPASTFCTQTKTRQQLERDLWRQKANGLWEQLGVIENYSCVMISIAEMGYEKGPSCYNNINRWRWSLFAVAVMLLLSLTLLITFSLRDFIKKSVRRWRSRFVKIKRTHVLVLSPPDSGREVSAAVCGLGSLLSSRDFSVAVDQWSRQDQFSLGPLPWSHCQLLSTDSQCERVVLVLTPKAVEKAQTWSSQDCPAIGLQEESPYSDVFRASLFAIQAFKNQGRANERFVLVTFDYLWTDKNMCHNALPQILQGLPLFHFPSQTKALLSDLCAWKTRTQLDRGRWTWTLSGNNKHKKQEASQEYERKLLPQF